MKYKYLLIVVLIIIGLVLVEVPTGLAEPPPMPSSFYGTVKENGSNVPLSTKISAWINGVKYAETPVIIYIADTVYTLDVPGDIAGTAEIEGGKSGDLIFFYIGNRTANQTGFWQSGTNTELNLSTITPNGSFKIYLPNIIN